MLANLLILSNTLRIFGLIYLAGFLITLPPNGPFVSNSSFSAKVAIIKPKSATIVFFFSLSSPPFLLLALSFSPFFFLRYCDVGASQA